MITSRLPQWYADRIERIDGVQAAVPMQVLVSNCRASLDVVTFRGVPDDKLDDSLTPDQYNKKAFEYLENEFGVIQLLEPEDPNAREADVGAEPRGSEERPAQRPHDQVEWDNPPG